MVGGEHECCSVDGSCKEPWPATGGSLASRRSTTTEGTTRYKPGADPKAPAPGQAGQPPAKAAQAGQPPPKAEAAVPAQAGQPPAPKAEAAVPAQAGQPPAPKAETAVPAQAGQPPPEAAAPEVGEAEGGQGGGLWSQDWGNWGQNQTWEVQSNQTWQEAQQQEVEEMSWQAWNDLERLDEHMGSIVFLG